MNNDYRDYISHGLFNHKYVRKEKNQKGEWRYIYPEDIKTKTKLGKSIKKLYNQTVAWKQAQADRDARTKTVAKHNGKKISNNVYVDHEDHFNIPETYKKHQTGSTTYYKDSNGEKRSIRVQFNTKDDMITKKDLIDTIKRNLKNKVNYKKFKARKKFENFLEAFGYKDPKKVKTEIENREFNKRINAKMANQKPHNYNKSSKAYRVPTDIGTRRLGWTGPYQNAYAKESDYSKVMNKQYSPGNRLRKAVKKRNKTKTSSGYGKRG